MKAFAPEEISQNYLKRLEEQMKYDERLLAVLVATGLEIFHRV